MNTQKPSRLFRPLLALELFLLAGCATPQAAPVQDPVRVTVLSEKPLTAEAAKADIALARQALIDIHPGYHRYADPVALEERWEELVLSVQDGTSDRALYVGLSGVLTDIRCDHTKAEQPASLEDSRKSTASFFPFRPILSRDGVFVFSAADGTGLMPGDQLISINGQSMDDVTQSILAMVPVDGYTDHVKPVAFEATGEFLGSAFEHFYPLIYGAWRTLDVEIERASARQSITLEPISWEAWRALDWAGPAYRSDFVDAVTFDVLEEGVGYLRIDTFVNYRRPVDPAEIYGPIFDQLQAEGFEKLIIDTRFNGGGSTDAVIGLIGFLTEDSSPLFASKQVRSIDLSAYADVIDTWDPRALTPDPTAFDTLDDGWFEILAEKDPISLGPIPAQAPRFEGEVVALTSRANASGVTILLSTLRDRIDALLIGEATGGSSEGPTAGQIFFLELPNSGIRVRIPWQLQSLNVASFEPGLGVTPDIEIAVTASDRLSGRDPILEAAMDRLQGP
ncbi:MAG: S41 family peptidase [Pseudomonadota bacterium]